jgi:hypothetical protein
MEELKESENFAANTTGSSNSTALTEAVAVDQRDRDSSGNTVQEVQTIVGFPMFNSSFGV